MTVVPATATAKDILAHKPDGIFLSNGPGDPAATGKYAVPTIKALMETGKPIFGICLGHQLLGLALGGKTDKMHQGHHGANHPVKDLTTGKVEITSMNHGFAVDTDSLPAGVTQTHVSLFDGSNAGLAVDGKPIFSVQYHPEASPGPHDSHYLFTRFLNLVRAQKGMPAGRRALQAANKLHTKRGRPAGGPFLTMAGRSLARPADSPRHRRRIPPGSSEPLASVSAALN